jgi:hypothetical protein
VIKVFATVRIGGAAAVCANERARELRHLCAFMQQLVQFAQHAQHTQQHSTSCMNVRFRDTRRRVFATSESHVTVSKTPELAFLLASQIQQHACQIYEFAGWICALACQIHVLASQVHAGKAVSL